MEPIFELVHSMNKNEKAHFKKYNALRSYKEKNNLFRLFEFIDKQEVYDENQLKIKLKDKNFSLTKFSLFEQIHASLRNFHEDSSSTLKANALLNSVEIMVSKNMIQHADFLNSKAKKIALDEGHQELLQRALFNELYFLMVPEKLPKNIEQHNALFEELKQCNSQLQHRNEYIYLLAIVMLPIRQGISLSNPLHKEVYDIFLESKALQLADDLLSPEYHIYKYRALSMLSTLEGDLQKSLDFNSKIAEILANKKDILKNNARSLIAAYRNVLGGSVLLKDWTKGENALKMLRSFIQHPDIVKNNSQLIYATESYFVSVGYFYASLPSFTIEAKETLEELRKSMIEYKEYINQSREDTLVIIYYYFALIELRKGNFENALQYANDFYLNRKDLNRFQSLVFSIDLVKILCFYKLEETEVATNLLRSVKRQFKTQIETSPFLKEAVSLITSKLSNSLSKNTPLSASPQNELELAIYSGLEQM